MAQDDVAHAKPDRRKVGPPIAEPPDAPGLIKIGPMRDQSRLRQLYREADLFILPTLYDTFGFVICEAMSQGLPCIASDFKPLASTPRPPTGFASIPLGNCIR